MATPKWYCGIVDCYGLESFFETSDNAKAPPHLFLRASHNRHRHAMVYWVYVDEKKVEWMNNVIEQAQKDNDWTRPAKLLKNSDFVADVYFEDAMKDSWELIPNPKLDNNNLGYGGSS